MADSQEVKDVLAAIKKTDTMKARIHKELGIGSSAVSEIAPADMYMFEYKKPDLEHRSWIILHGKCIGEGQKQLREWGYEFLQTNHIPLSDKSRSGTRCEHCKELLDAEHREKYLAERKILLAKKHEEYLEEKAIREEWEAEQILLGKL